VGSLGPYDANYLVKPNPAAGSVQSYQVDAPTLGPDADGNYEFAALLWAPNAMPAPNVALVDLAVTATQQGAVTVGKISIAVKPPPLLLIHGIWSSAAGARFAPGEHGFYDFVTSRYPHNLIRWVDYGVKVGGSPVLSSLTFSDSRTQNILLSNMTDLLADAAGQGMAARSVDVVAHSMGGLVTRYFLSTPGPLSPEFLPNPVHKFITIGTPHLGSNLAKALITNQGLSINTPSPIAQAWCGFTGSCTLGKVMGSLGKQVSTGAQSLEPGSPELNFLLPSNVFSAIVGSAPPVSETEGLLDVLINAFLPGQTVSSLLNNHANDTVVDVFSQNPGGAADTATITGLVHTAICDAPVLSAVCVDTGETASPAFWAQAYYWLTGGAGTVPAPSLSNFAPRPMTSTQPAPLPVLDLSGYTQVAASNVTFLPATGSALTINNAAAITASSSKTITEVLLLQAVTDPTDTALLSSTQSPFTIAFMPTRLGSANFGAIAVFSDNTYAATALSYTLQPDGTPYALNLVNAPVASMAAAESRVIEADAEFTSGPVNVTQAATYTARSGSTSVFSVSTGGTITATGNGVDLLDVTYGGVTATAQIPVGPCTYALNPTNQIVAYTGGTATIQVMTQSGCAWTADGGAAWLPLTQASGSGNGAIALTAAANSSGGAQGAMVTVGGLQALVTQPTTACVYSLSQTQISVLAVGGSGAITATTSCPVIASSDQSWLTANPLGATVPYTVAPNLGTSPRSATLTVGTVGVPVTQAGFVPPAILQIALGHFGNIWQGQIAAAYTVTVSDQAAGGPVSGMVTVTETVPSGLTLVSMSGTGWNCSSNVCTRSDTINSGAGYPAIAVNVNVAANAPSAVTNQVSVSGGGSVTASASDLTAISAFSTCDFQQNGSMNAADVQLIINEALGITAAVNDLNGDGVVNVLDVQIEINAALGLGCAAM
jgi:pimeloyl-ACP methyl ester carboxylesterase